MGSSVIINVPSPPSSSSSSSSSSSRIHRTAENEGEDRDGLEVDTKLSDLNRPCQSLGHEVSRLILDNVENNKILMSLKRRIEEFNQGENQLNLEIEQLERKVLMLMLEKGLKDDKLEKFGEEKEIEGREVLKGMKLEQKFLDLMLEIGESNDKFNDLGIGIEETRKCEKDEVFKELGTDLARQQMNLRQLVSDKKEPAQKFEKTENVVDEVVSVSDDGDEEEEIGAIGARGLCKEIELLEAMLERGSFGLLDLQMMMEEVEALKGPEKMVSEIEVKMGELESGLWELKSAIVELKGKKSKELMGWVTKEEEKELECDGQEEVNASKLNWGLIIASVGAVVAAAAVVFTGRTRVEVKAERGNRLETEIQTQMVAASRFKPGSLTVKIIRVPLISGKLSLKPQIDGILKRIKSWTVKDIFFDGRLRLINSVFFSVQNYWWCKVFILPKKITGLLNHKSNALLWKGKDTKATRTKSQLGRRPSSKNRIGDPYP